MADQGSIANLKQNINDNIYQNTAKDITGGRMNTVLQNIVDTLTKNGFRFFGIANPTTNPGTPDQNVFYLASTAGTYTNMGGVSLTDGEIAVLTYNGNWTKSSLGAFAPRGLSSVKKLTRLYRSTVSIEYSGTTAIITFTKSESQVYFYHETGYVTVNNNTGTTTLQLVDGINLICYNQSEQSFVIRRVISEIKDDDVLFEAFYAYNGNPLFGCWTSPIVTKTGGPAELTNGLSYQLPSMTPTIPKTVKRATRIFSGSISMTLNNDNTITVVTTGGYPYSETNNIQISAGTYVLPITLQSNNYIYASVDQTIKIATNLSGLDEREILLEAFYTYGGVGTSPFMAMWTSPFISKTNFPAEYFAGNCAFENPNEIKSIQDAISGITEKPRFSSIRIFQRVGCIGDSYTQGYIHLNGESPISSNPNYAWPHYMELITGNKWTNWGYSGSTAKGWMSGAAYLSQVQAAGNKCQAYIIGLMINDRNNAAWNLYYTPVGVIGDIGTDNDTYYAWYYKLVQAVLTVNPDAKIFCPTCPLYAKNDAYNQAVRDIVTYCQNNNQNVFLADLAADKYRNEQYFQNPAFIADAVNGHYTATGYEFMADCYMEILSDVIHSNVAKFQDVFKIPFDTVS